MTSAVKRSYPFGSRQSLAEETQQFKVPQVPLHKKMSMTSTNLNVPVDDAATALASWTDNDNYMTPNDEKGHLQCPPSSKGRKNMKNLQLVVPPVRSSISAPNSPQLPPNTATHTHNRRPSTPICVYQNKGSESSNPVDPMALMSKTENAIGEDLPYKEGPIQILPNLYLGTELNAANRTTLNELNIEFILNVAKEVENPYLEEIVKSNNSASYQHSHHLSVPSDDSFYSTIQSPMSPAVLVDSPLISSPFSGFRSSTIQKRSSTSPSAQFAHNAMLSGLPLTVPASSDHASLKYKKFFWTHNQVNLISDFASAFSFIDEARSAGRNILVHCQCGVSRSASLIIGYVMKANCMTLNQAYEFVKNRSPYISPNMSLVYQLVDFEKTLKLGNNNNIYNSLPGTPTKSNSEIARTHSRSSSIESDLLLKTHRRSGSIPKNNGNNVVFNIAPAHDAPPKTPVIHSEGLLSTQNSHQSTVKGGTGRFHVITASITPTSPSALSPVSSLSPTSTASPTTPSSESSSPTTKPRRSSRPQPLSSDTPISPKEIINSDLSSISTVPFVSFNFDDSQSNTSFISYAPRITNDILSGQATRIFSKSTLESIFSPTRTSPPITPVTIPYIFLDDE